MLEILTKFVSVLQADSTLQTLLGGTSPDKKIYPMLNNKFEAFPCITYEEISSPQNTVPANTQTTTIIIKTFAKNNKKQAEQINARVKTLFNYYHTQTPRLFWVRKSDEFDNNESDRLVFCKVLRYTVWSNIVS